ncbi:hypothetical protein ACFFWD_31675 [Bradyrhizobium erythrophlei]|uniref:hypothetical protein n=1 Tax=Bradyrhizobium erythrophlei TaxID=1437360 RepID=UPI0035E9F178
MDGREITTATDPTLLGIQSLELTELCELAQVRVALSNTFFVGTNAVVAFRQR